MKIRFKDNDDGIWFEYCETIPENFSSLGEQGRINLTGLYLYSMYRNTIYDSYRIKPDLAEDIKTYKKVFREKDSSTLSQSSTYNDPLYHYSVAGAISAIKEWENQHQKMLCYFAYQNISGRKKIVGFVGFVKRTLSDAPVVYIAQAGVINRSHGVGKRLMECVLSDYPPETRFTILTRIFNSEAKSLYHRKLNFSPMSEEMVKQLGYDERYCGFEHTTSIEEIHHLNERKEILLADILSTSHQEMEAGIEEAVSQDTIAPSFLLSVLAHPAIKIAAAVLILVGIVGLVFARFFSSPNQSVQEQEQNMPKETYSNCN